MVVIRGVISDAEILLFCNYRIDNGMDGEPYLATAVDVVIRHLCATFEVGIGGCESTR
jgi:hypothetical protein